jgi:hypothetical protein
VCAGLAAGLFAQIGQAGTLQLTLYLDIDARQFLNASHQSILIVVPNPASEADNTVVALTLPPPIADSMKLIIEPDSSLYIANGTVSSVDVINMGLITSVLYGNAYSFNGVQINGDGKGKDGTVGIYYEAPSNSQPLITGWLYLCTTAHPANPQHRRRSTLLPSTVFNLAIYRSLPRSYGSWSAAISATAV